MLGSFGVGVLVRVVLEGQRPVRLANAGAAGAMRDAQRRIGVKRFERRQGGPRLPVSEDRRR